MKKTAFRLCVLLITGLSGACNQLTQYTINEQEVNQALKKHNNYQKEFGVSGLVNANVVLNDLSATIGREEPDKITLTAKAHVNFISLLGPQQADMLLTMKTQPIFDKTQGAIYLKALEITDSRVQPEKMQAILTSLTPWLNQSLRSYFDRHPAWVLSEDRGNTEALAKRFVKGFTVKPGQLVISFTN